VTTLDEQSNFATGRLGANYAYDFSEKSKFEARGAYLFNLNDTEDSEGDARLSLTAPVAGRLALKVSYDFLYRNQPLPGLEKLDSTFGVGIQASF
jgi:putative salt-induced outer membrane protein YdiY